MLWFTVFFVVFYFEIKPWRVSSSFSVSPVCSSISVFPFVTSPVIFPPLSPHLFLILSLVCLYIVFVLPLIFFPLWCFTLLRQSVPGYPVLVCRSSCLSFGRFLVSYFSFWFELCFFFALLHVFWAFYLLLCISTCLLVCLGSLGFVFVQLLLIKFSFCSPHFLTPVRVSAFGS